jgi:hypothetical protein
MIHPEVQDYIRYEREDLMTNGFSRSAAQRKAEKNIRDFMLGETQVWLAHIFCPRLDKYAGAYTSGFFIGPEGDTDEPIDVADEELDEPEDL